MKTKISMTTAFSMLSIISLILIFIFGVSANTPGTYSQNVTVKVNVTNAYPVIWDMTINPSPIDLIPGSSRQINCTIEAYDWNGKDDMNLTNATLWHSSSSMGASDDNITHYTNTNCTFEDPGNGPYNATFHCSFDLTYFTDSGSWTCNATVMDKYNFTDSETNTTTVNPLFAINVTSVIDFGEAAVGDVINNRTANITNFGNQALNISVEGYGRTAGDDLAMVCDVAGNIPIANLKFSGNSSSTYASGSTALTSAPLNITDFTVPKITNQIWKGNTSSTYWHLFIDPTNNPFGLCNGTVVFTAWNAI